jgi:hypothetical protein
MWFSVSYDLRKPGAIDGQGYFRGHIPECLCVDIHTAEHPGYILDMFNLMSAMHKMMSTLQSVIHPRNQP